MSVVYLEKGFRVRSISQPSMIIEHLMIQVLPGTVLGGSGCVEFCLSRFPRLLPLGFSRGTVGSPQVRRKGLDPSAVTLAACETKK